MRNKQKKQMIVERQKQSIIDRKSNFQTQVSTNKRAMEGRIESELVIKSENEKIVQSLE